MIRRETISLFNLCGPLPREIDVIRIDRDHASEQRGWELQVSNRHRNLI